MPAQALAGLHTDPGDARSDAAPAHVGTAPAVVVALGVPSARGGSGVQLDRAAPGPAATDALDGSLPIEQRREQHRVVPVGAGQDHVERQTIGGDEQAVLRAQLTSVREVRSCQRAPPSRSDTEALPAVLMASGKPPAKPWCVPGATASVCNRRLGESSG